MAEMDEDTAEVFAVFFDTVIESFDVGLVEEAQDALFELAASFTGDDFDEADAFVYRFLYDAV